MTQRARLTTMTVVTHELQVPALPASLDEIHDLVSDMWPCTPGVEAQDQQRFEAALVEVAANIIEYARPADGRAVVTLDLNSDLYTR